MGEIYFASGDRTPINYQYGFQKAIAELIFFHCETLMFIATGDCLNIALIRVREFIQVILKLCFMYISCTLLRQEVCMETVMF